MAKTIVYELHLDISEPDKRLDGIEVLLSEMVNDLRIDGIGSYWSSAMERRPKEFKMDEEAPHA